MKKTKLKDIKACPWNARGEITAESVKELAKSIAENGLINPITLWKDSNGSFCCIAGNRRLAAIRSLNLKDYDGELHEGDYTIFDGDENEAKMVTVTENLQREDVGVIEEAELVKTCLDSGMTVDEVAAKTGRGNTWVRQRAKLAALDEKWSAFAKENQNAVTADALEKIAAYPSAVQKSVWKRCKPSVEGKYGWSSFRWAFERESYDIESSGICKDKKICAKCKRCANRTGAEPDLFGETDGRLGKCLDKKCFESTVKAYRDAAVKKAVGDSESVVCESRWSMPTEADGERRTAKKPCAYVYFDGGDIEVKWGPSKKKLDAEREAAKVYTTTASAEEFAKEEKRKLIRSIVTKLESCFDCTREDGALEGLATKMVEKHTDEELDFIVTATVEKLTNWRSNREWADFIRRFSWSGKLAGLSDSEEEILRIEFPESTDEG